MKLKLDNILENDKIMIIFILIFTLVFLQMLYFSIQLYSGNIELNNSLIPDEYFITVGYLGILISSSGVLVTIFGIYQIIWGV